MKGLIFVLTLAVAVGVIGAAEKPARPEKQQPSKAQTAKPGVSEPHAPAVETVKPVVDSNKKMHDERVALDRVTWKLRSKRAYMRRVDRVVARAEKQIVEWRAHPTYTVTRTEKQRLRCGTCNGTGRYRNKKCPTCGGKGYSIRLNHVTEQKTRNMALAEKQMAQYLAVQKKTRAEVEALEKKVADLKALIEAGQKAATPGQEGKETAEPVQKPEAEETKQKRAPTRPTTAGSR